MCVIGYIDIHVCIYVYSLLLDLNFEIYFVGFRIWGFFFQIISEQKIPDKSYVTVFMILSAKTYRKRDSAQLSSNRVFPNSVPFGNKVHITVAVNVNSKFRIFVYENCQRCFFVRNYYEEQFQPRLFNIRVCLGLF